MVEGNKRNEWREWIDERCERRKEEYTLEPGRVVSDYNREQSGTRGYSGRILLEMLQNADDAGLDQGEPVEVLVYLSDEHLLIANTGEPFDERGLGSLIISDNSPKQFRSDSIGYKGLGFRSLFNWTSSVAVLSGDLSVGFDNQHAKEFLDEIRQESQALDEKIKEYEDNGISDPIATLSVPQWLEAETISNPSLKEAYKRGVKLKEEGFDTVLCIPLDGLEAKQEVQDEINELFKEVALFLQNIYRLEIRSPGRKVTWEIHRDDDEDTVTIVSDESSTTWNITKEKDTLPNRLREEGSKKKKYEIKVAVPTDGDVQTAINRNLSVFFPTQVSFPFPVLAHATFEVTDDRNHLVISDTNRFVAERLASVMAETADGLRIKHDDPWFPFSVVSPETGIDRTLNKLGPKGAEATFEDVLRREIEEMQIIPVQGGGFESPQNAYRVASNLDGLLKPATFVDVALHPKERRLEAQLDALSVKQLEYDELRKRFDQISPTLSTDERAKIIYRLLTDDLIEADQTPELLIDGDQQIIASDLNAFLPPTGEQISLPKWVPQRILDSDLTSSLREKFEVTSNRDLKHSLDPFPVSEYNLGRLVQAIVAEANRRVEKEPAKELKWRRRMLQAIWDLRSSRDDEIALPEDLTVRLPTRTGGSKPADDLYIGEEYPSGRLLERLYQPTSRDSFVATPDTLDVIDDRTKLQEFLCWLGVAKEPRTVEVDDPGSDYCEYILSELGYPVKFGSEEIESKEEYRSLSGSKQLKNVSTIDRLDEILEKSDPHAIIGLLATMGSELDAWRRDGDRTAIFRIKPKYKRNWRSLRSDSIPPYPLWAIQTTDWLPVEGGELLPPTRSTLSTEGRQLSPVIGYPAVDMANNLLTELNIDTTSIKIALQKAGVARSLEELSWDSFYDVLSKLPEIDPNGNIAERLYSLLLSKNGEASGEGYAQFIEDGQILGEFEGELGYFPIDELRFPESGSLPTAVVDQYPIVKIPTRHSGAMVERLFGVETLSMDQVTLTSAEPETHYLANDFERGVEQLKAYVYALRMGTTRESLDRATIKKLNLELCESFEATASVDGEDVAIELEPGTFLSVDSTVYLVPQPIRTSSPLDDDDLAGLIGDVFSTVLDVNMRKEVYILAKASDREKTFSIVAEQGTRIVHEARRRLDVDQPDEDTFEPPEINLNGSSPNEPTTPSESRKGITTTTPTTDGSVHMAEIGSVEVSQVNFETVDERNISIKRLGKTPSSTTRQGARRVADGYRAEDICMNFEKCEGRVPVKVSHIHGSESYGCDIISFENEERRQQFEKQRDPALIKRYIEVKASTSEKNSITLKGNQLEAAQKHQERFFLYRAYERFEDGTSYELVVLSDPTGRIEAIDPRIDVNPFRTEESECYELQVLTDERSEEEESTKKD